MGKPPHAAIAAQGSHTSPVAMSGKSSNISETDQILLHLVLVRDLKMGSSFAAFFSIIKSPLMKFTIEKNPLNMLKTKKKIPGSPLKMPTAMNLNSGCRYLG